MDQEDRERLNGARARVLARLLKGPATGPELCAPEVGGMGGIRRKWELEQAGWMIEKKKTKGGTWTYKITGAHAGTDAADDLGDMNVPAGRASSNAPWTLFDLHQRG